MALTGRKVFAITAGSFGVIIAVNLVMAFKAISTFPGLDVPNSYVASQTFDAERKAQLGLGWRAGANYDGGTLEVRFTGRNGAPVKPAAFAVTVGRPTERDEDKTPRMGFADGAFTAPVTLNPGLWYLWIEAQADDGTRFHQRLPLRVR